MKGFWSLTLYNDEKFFFPNALNRFSLGTKNKTLKYAAGRLADPLPGREVAGQGERGELDTGARRPLLADPAALLA